jgi:autotransporter-associated beta strand protein
MLSAGVLLSLAPSAFATIGVTNGTFGTSNTNCLTVHNGGWLESTVTTNWVEGSWSNGNATAFPTGMVCLFDGTAANGYIYQSLGILTAGEIAQGLLRVTCDFSEKSDDATVNGTFDVFAGTMASPVHGTDIAAAGLTNIFSRTMTAADQGLTASSGNNSRQTKVVGTIDISSLTPGTELWIRVSRPSSGGGDFIIDNLTTTIITAPLNWDINGTTAGAGGATPTGVWDGATANWSTSPDGASAPTAWTEGKPATFAAGSDATGSYTVTVSGTRTTESLACEEGTVLLTGGEIALTSPAGISAASGSQLRIESILSGSSGISTSGTGTTILAGANGYSGSTSLAGTVRLDGGAAIPDSSPVAGVAGASVTLLSDETIGDLSGSGSFALGGNTLRVGTATASTNFGGAFTGAGSWIKQGSGILILTGQSSFTGAVVVNEGTVSAQGPAADGAFPNATSVTIHGGGTVVSGSNGLFGYNNHPVPVTVNAGGTLTVNGGSNGGPNMFGILTLAGGNVAEDNSVHGTYGSYNFGGASIIATGTTTSTLSARDFQLRNSATTLQVDAGATLNVTGYFTGLAHAAGKTLNKTGTGKLILASGTASSHGATNVNEGTLELTGTHGNGKITVAAGATLAGTGITGGVVEVQANGLLTTADNLIEDLTLNSSVTLAGITALEITKDGGTPANDQIFVMSGVTYGGTLTVSNITADASILSVGDSFKLFDASTYGGGFTTFDLPVLPAGLSWDRSGLTTTGTITVINNVSSPVFTPPGGGYAGAQSVAISSDSGSTIYYTLDGSTPGPSSMNGPSPVSGITVPTNTSMTIKAYAVKAGQGNSSVATAQYTTVTTPTWTEAFGGNWSNTDTFNWLSGVVANGADVTADFSTLTLDADASVFLTDARTIGHLRFGDVGNTYGWTLSGSELALLAGPSPSITVNNQRTTISTPLAGTTGMRKEGAGILQLAANEDYTGNTAVNGGTLELAAGGAAYTNSTLQGTLTVNGGATCSLVSATALGWGGGLTDIHLNGGELSGAGAMAFGVSYHLTGGTINATGSIRMGVLTGFPNVTLNSAASPTTSVINAGGLSLATTFGQDSLAVTVAQGSTPSGIDLQINAPISGSYSLVKAGAGNLQLAGANTYGGVTSVNEGTLTITGSVTSGTTVTGTAKLAGTGNTIGGATIGGTAFVAPAGDSAGELLSGPATVYGTYQCQLNGAANDRLTVTGNLTFGAASTIACSTLAGGATQSSYVIASFTGTLTGTPQVTGMPAGYALDLTTPNQVRLVKASGYSDWATQWAGGQGIDQDFDGDGVANGIEYFMGQTTSGFTAGPSLDGNVVSWSKGASYTGTYGVDYWIETSASLGIGSWTAVPANDPNLGNGSPLQYTHPAAQSKVFSRLVVTGP